FPHHSCFLIGDARWSGSRPGCPMCLLASASDEPHGLPDGDDVDRAWRQLLTAVPARDSATIDLALGTIAEFWIAETEGDWRFFHPRSAPDFDPEPCAAATIARRRGWGPRALTDEVCDYLDAGLADGFPDPLYPQLPPLRPEPADRGE
ncbi:hypothetical protein AB0J86_11995, partial [Micromonospora sp. NPDC049559]|uniref:hypothetical protein n=1 Tax=Micromonospora sp. NPDC049559 TaxID=3155923 RepID=UPI003449B4E2